MDFTVQQYRKLLKALVDQSYTFQTFNEFIESPASRSIVLRHDVDLLPQNSLAFARIQKEFNVKGVYYFRAVPESWDEKIILEIAELGHEIGYHYENLTTCNGSLELGYKDFTENLRKLNKLVPVSTICMHGSPASEYDSKDLWKKYSYKDLGIIGEPYFDVDFKKVFYITDTGRRWDGEKVSVRDKVNSSFDLSFHATMEIIENLNAGKFPEQVMFTFHPQRWNDNLFLWTKELVLQNIKNMVKRFLFVKAIPK
jgi:hypothetical protein